MNEAHPARFVVAAALLVDAVIGHMLFRAGFQENGTEPWLAATLLAIFVGGIALVIAVRPTRLTLQLARGAAAGMLLGLAGIALLYFVAANFESGVSSAEMAWAITWGSGLVIAQLAILIGSGFVDGTTITESIGATAAGAFKFWLVSAAVIMITLTIK